MTNIPSQPARQELLHLLTERGHIHDIELAKHTLEKIISFLDISFDADEKGLLTVTENDSERYPLWNLGLLSREGIDFGRKRLFGRGERNLHYEWTPQAKLWYDRLVQEGTISPTFPGPYAA